MQKTRWQSERDADDSRRYVERFAELEASGADLHGEARFVDVLLPRGARVLDAGCGTGRVGAELLRRGHRVTAVDLDPVLLAEARRCPGLDVRAANLAELDLEEHFDAVVAAGNVMVFVAPGTEDDVVRRVRRHLEVGGVFVAGFTTDARYGVREFDRDLTANGFELVHRFAGWAMEPWHDDAEWVVTVARAT